jgi:hypothetical protein
MTTAAKIPAGLSAYPADVTTKEFLSVSTWTSSTSTFASATTTWIDKVEVRLVGQPDAAKEPAKTMNTWATTNAAAITAAGLTDQLKVSSWAIIVDVTTKASTSANASKESFYNQVVAKNDAGNCVDNLGNLATAVA